MYVCMNVSAYPSVCIIRNTWYVRTCTHIWLMRLCQTPITLLWSVWNMFQVIHMATDLDGVLFFSENDGHINFHGNVVEHGKSVK